MFIQILTIQPSVCLYAQISWGVWWYSALWECCFPVKPWFIAVIPPPQHKATWLGVINRDTSYSCTVRHMCGDRYKLTHTQGCAHAHTLVWPLHSLIAWDWWGDQWPIPVCLWREYWFTLGCRVAFKDLVNHQGLPKLSDPNITSGKVTSQGKRFY